MTEALSWTDYVKMIAKTDGILYHQALATASKTWPDYKAKHGSVAKSEPQKPANNDAEQPQAKPAKKPAPKPRKPRITKAKKQQEEMEKLKMKADLLEAQLRASSFTSDDQSKLKEKKKSEKKEKKKPAPKPKKKKVKVESESEESQSE